jgi:hypothetical protein
MRKHLPTPAVILILSDVMVLTAFFPVSGMGQPFVKEGGGSSSRPRTIRLADDKPCTSACWR